MLDFLQYEIRCLYCGHRGYERIGWLLKHPEFRCPRGCGATISSPVVDLSEFSPESMRSRNDLDLSRWEASGGGPNVWSRSKRAREDAARPRSPIIRAARGPRSSGCGRRPDTFTTLLPLHLAGVERAEPRRRPPTLTGKKHLPRRSPPASRALAPFRKSPGDAPRQVRVCTPHRGAVQSPRESAVSRKGDARPGSSLKLRKRLADHRLHPRHRLRLGSQDDEAVGKDGLVHPVGCVDEGPHVFRRPLKDPQRHPLPVQRAERFVEPPAADCPVGGLTHSPVARS